MNESTSITVIGMKCGGCETNVKSTLEALDGVSLVNASSKDNQVDVDFDNDKISLDVIKASIVGAGFEVK